MRVGVEAASGLLLLLLLVIVGLACIHVRGGGV